MMWSIIAEVDCEPEIIERIRAVLVDTLELTTGVRPRTKTIQTAALELALRPPEPVQSVRPLRDTRQRKLA